MGGDGALVAQKRYPQKEGYRGQEGHEKDECLHSALLPSGKQADHEAEQDGQQLDHRQQRDRRRLDESADLPLHSRESEGSGGGGGGDGQKLPSLPLVGLLVLFFFLYVGIEVGFGAWVAVVVLRDGLAGEAGAALMAR